MTRIITLSTLLVSLAACQELDTAPDFSAGGETASTGHATFGEDEGSESGSAEVEGPIWIEVVAEGSASFPELDPECALDGAEGEFTGFWSGSAEIGEGGVYAAQMGEAEAFVSASGCEVPRVDILVVSDLVVLASVETTTANCEGYCSAEFGVSDDGAGALGECVASCETEHSAISAETRLDLEALAALNARDLSGGALGELEVDLHFNRLD